MKRPSTSRARALMASAALANRAAAPLGARMLGASKPEPLENPELADPAERNNARAAQADAAVADFIARQIAAWNQEMVDAGQQPDNLRNLLGPAAVGTIRAALRMLWAGSPETATREEFMAHLDPMLDSIMTNLSTNVKPGEFLRQLTGATKLDS